MFWFFGLLAFGTGLWPLGVVFFVIAAVIHLLRASR
jgi:hypothetical protein